MTGGLIGRIVLAVIVAIVIGLLCILIGDVLASLGVPIAVTIGDFLAHWGWVLGILAGLWFFFTGRTFDQPVTTQTVTLIAPVKAGGSIVSPLAMADGDSLTATVHVPPPPAWTFGANENGTFTLPAGNWTVRYGANTTYITKPFAGGTKVSCNNATFTDPLYGTVKHCDYQPAATPPPPPPPPPSNKTLQQIIDGTQSGGSVDVSGLLFRESAVITKPITLTGANWAISGADVFTFPSGSRTSTQTVPSFSMHGSCNNGSVCLTNYIKVFLDGVLTTAWAFDASRHVVMSADPAGHVVEVVTRQTWLTASVPGVTIVGLRAYGATNDAQTGALVTKGANGIVLQGLDLSYAHGSNLSLDNVTGPQVIGCAIHDGGQMGIHQSNCSGALISGGSLSHNNSDGFSIGWEAGGHKATSAGGLNVFDGIEVHHNLGPGLWLDIDGGPAEFKNCRFHHNGAGVMVEISANAHIHNNVFYEEGWHDVLSPTWAWPAAVLLSSCRDVEVDHNVIAWSKVGIGNISQERLGNSQTTPPPTGSWDDTSGRNIHDNTIVMDAPNEAIMWVSDYAANNLLTNSGGGNNRFYYPTAEGGGWRWTWGPTGLSYLADWVKTPTGAGDAYLTQAQAMTALTAAGIPTAPETGH